MEGCGLGTASILGVGVGVGSITGGGGLGMGLILEGVAGSILVGDVVVGHGSSSVSNG